MLPVTIPGVPPITVAGVHFDLETRVAVVEIEFFEATDNRGNRDYQLKLCEQLHAKCVDAALNCDNDSVDAAIELVARMDAVLLKGLEKTGQAKE